MSVTTESPGTPVPSSSKPGGGQPRRVGGGLLDPKILWKSLPDAFKKLDPRVQIKNPVMFVVEVGSVLTLYTAIKSPSVFNWTIVVWLWLTVVFANLAEAVAEGRGKAQAETLRQAKRETMARRLTNWQPGMEASALHEESVAGTALQLGDYVVVEAGQVIPGDGDVVEGVASVDESAITGESAPVIRESGGDRSAVTGGTTVLSDRIVVKITSKPGETFIDRMIALVEGAKRQKTPNEIALNILLAALTIIFMLAVITLQPMAYYSDAPQTLVILVALLVALIPTTIGALLSAIGIAGMDRLVQRNVLAMSGRAVEAAGDVMRKMGIRTVMITGDNPLTAKAIADESGVDDFLAEATPEDKMALIRKEQQGGKLVAMTGDGTNDAPALAQADVGVAMNTGTSAAKEAGNMVDLDSNPTKLIEIVEIGKQLLITRGALTTFSITNDVAKYFAIIPAMFSAVIPGLGKLNILHLYSPKSAITSAIIFNALIIVALIPLALRGVRYKPASASSMLRRNLLIYGVGGAIIPFIGIWAIDLIVQYIPGFGR